MNYLLWLQTTRITGMSHQHSAATNFANGRQAEVEVCRCKVYLHGNTTKIKTNEWIEG
jgi:hypothetical protein